jgi:hypothetical protein
MRSVNRAAIFERLKHSIQLLACPANIQLKMIPDFVCKPDELPLDFDYWNAVVLGNFRSELTTDQISSSESIDRALSELTDIGPEHWTEDAVRKSEEWHRLRTLAALA